MADTLFPDLPPAVGANYGFDRAEQARIQDALQSRLRELQVARETENVPLERVRREAEILEKT